jgi:pyridoxine kinase
MTRRPCGSVIVLSSHVARGSVGNRAMVFALERLGFPVWAVPTVTLPHHPGHGPATRIIASDEAFKTLLEALIQDQEAVPIAGIISGYLAAAGQVHAVAGLVNRLKAARPDLLYLCDPLLGDTGGIYIGAAVAQAIRDVLVPLADIATPNAFECGWLAGALDRKDDLAELARSLGPAVVLVTSAPALMRGHIGNLLVEGDRQVLLEHPALPTPAKGTGDLLAALLLARRLEGHDWAKAAELAVSSVFEIVAGTAKAGADELLLAEFQHAIVQPRAPISVRRIGARGSDYPRPSR